MADIVKDATDYRIKQIEIAEEIGITSILEDNEYIDLRKRIDYDLMDIGIKIGGTKSTA